MPAFSPLTPLEQQLTLQGSSSAVSAGGSAMALLLLLAMVLLLVMVLLCQLAMRHGQPRLRM
ncbi:hypothetical protein COO60DRAFT_1639600 [Scenedesmus sp. NREL 46B-D3]|nr:hypothetical protein COO60DRAFT_1639600 [Scenedesmus sp. NREL 46B-D3]